jgi:diguanylate cyclase (GGDEF)-like protein
MLIVMFVNLGVQIRFLYGLAGSALCGILGGVFTHLDRWSTGPDKLESAAVMTSGILLSLLGNHVIEYQERLNFLFRARSVMDTEELAAANASLQRAANEDELTTISNRRHFEEVYKQSWEQSMTAKSALSVIMIDIDHFKRLNDQYGHVHGDGVLNRIAAILREDLRARGDFVARYGGEEFIVVLANSSPEIAWRVAQRLRSLIETAGRAAGDSTEAFDQGWTTISCGVATAVPRESMEPRSLIVQADAALYHAKAEGRNRVWPARSFAPERLLA